LTAAGQPGWERRLPLPPVEQIEISAEDGVVVHGDYHPAYNAKAIVLLFHQAGASRDEYASIAPKLAEAGFSALAVDQRSGGDLFGPNRTVRGIGAATDYLEARRDIEAALAWSRRMDVPVFLVGSSYSSSLVLMVAADHPEVAGVASFSPGEYFGRDNIVAAAAARVRAPALIVTTSEEGEVLRSAGIVRALRRSGAELDRQSLAAGRHGAAAASERHNPAGAQQAWSVLLRWLVRHTAPRSPA